MVDLRPVLFVTGLFLSILAVGMCVPAIADLALSDRDWRVFAASAAVTMFTGVSLSLANRPKGRFDLSLRGAYLLTTISWAGASFFGSLPFMFSDQRLGLADAVFETMSGLTTTGSTVIVALDNQPVGILLWRGILQFLGGIGIIAMAVAILPFLRIGGMQLFRTESSDRSDKILPSVTQLAVHLVMIYTAFVALCAMALALAGMGPLDASTHAMSALATGGFSTKDASIGHYDSVAIELILIVAMAVGGATFTLYVRAWRGDFRALLRDSQLRWYLGMFATASLAIAAWQWLANGMAPLTALRHASFNVASVMTTTGFASTDFGQWGPFPGVIFFLLMFVGGCTGSTSGAIKVFRFQVLYAVVRTQLRRTLYPHATFMPTYVGRAIDEGVIASVMTFITLYVVVWAALSLGLALCGLDIVTALTGAATALGNVGPGLGEIIGPTGTFQPLPEAAKWMLTLGMMLGRLELLTVLLLLTPVFWRG
ncbi:MAG: TrkH family potassium uptake protein [Alphaproteobacteria bacterium]|nr:TrkH family potassium uptake protein [Alphaproteobacteria bacterium]